MRRAKLFKIQPELIAIHVPKTAGTAFYKMLRESYGVRAKRIQWPEDVAAWNRGLEFKSNKPFVKAIYGHIQAHPNWLEQYPKAKLITWLRDPTERVISHYYHWLQSGGIDDRYQDFISKKPSLLEFVSGEDFKATVRAYETHLGKISPEHFGFVGRTEHFDEDLLKLEGYLERKLPRLAQGANVNALKPKTSPEEKEQIKELLKSEYALYEELLRTGGHR